MQELNTFKILKLFFCGLDCRDAKSGGRRWSGRRQPEGIRARALRTKGMKNSAENIMKKVDEIIKN